LVRLHQQRIYNESTSDRCFTFSVLRDRAGAEKRVNTPVERGQRAAFPPADPTLLAQEIFMATRTSQSGPRRAGLKSLLLVTLWSVIGSGLALAMALFGLR
jgi:hypothetical protein